MWKCFNSSTAETPYSPWWGCLHPSSFYNCPEKTEFSWSKLLWMFNITLSPLEQNLFPFSANPKLFLPPLGSEELVSLSEWVYTDTVYSEFSLGEGGKRGMSLEAARWWGRDSPYNWLVRGLAMAGASHHSFWAVCWRDGRISLRVTLPREIGLHTQDLPIHQMIPMP